MTSASALVELGERYAALGLPAAARGVLVRAFAATEDATAARRLTELALAAGDSASACRYAREVAIREPGALSRILLGRAQLAAGELAGARFSFAAALEDVRLSPLARARAHLGRAAVAMAEGDRAGAGANVMAGLDEFARFASASDRHPGEVDAELPVAEELLTWAVDAGRLDDAAQHLDELDQDTADLGAGQLPVPLLRAMLLAARQARGDSTVSDSEIEQALVAELDRRPASYATRLRLIERRLRRRHQDQSAVAEAVADLERMANDLAETASSAGDHVELARVYFVLAAAYEADPGSAGKAEAFYRKGLALRPGHVTAANRLALLILARGDTEAALAEVERALRIDPGHGLAWRSAARVVEAASPGPDMHRLVARLLDAAEPGAGTAAGSVAPRLITAAAELARSDVLTGMYARGHRLKNVLGIIGSRTRSARKLARSEEQDPELSQRLTDLEREVTGLYNEWAGYLRSMQTTGPVIEVVSAGALLAEVVDAAAAKTAVPLDLSLARGLPDLRGDRMLLREALLNIVLNAAEACEAAGGQVEITARAVASGSPPVVEIAVADTGPGIPRADLGQIFAPGFTTKETGSGIGLAIAERAISAHHGRIVIDSHEGSGTCVTVLLPSDLGGFATLAAATRLEAEGT